MEVKDSLHDYQLQQKTHAHKLTAYKTQSKDTSTDSNGFLSFLIAFKKRIFQTLFGHIKILKWTQFF
jgi:hypothetical protein